MKEAVGVTFDPGKPPLVKACLALSGDHLRLGQVSEMLGLQPTRSGIKGEKRESPWPPVPQTFWVFEVTRSSFGIDEVLAELIDKLQERSDTIRGLASAPETSAAFVVTITIYENRPEYCLSAVTLERLASFGLELVIDIYDYGPD